MTTFEKVKQIAVEQLGVEEADVNMDSTFIDDLGADSLDVYEIVTAVEDEFDIEIDPEETEKIVTVEDAVNALKDAQKKNAESAV